MDIGQGMRDNFPQDEIDLKIKTAIAEFFSCYKKYLRGMKKNRRDRDRTRRFFSMNRRDVSGRARSPDCRPSR
jgi:hypothetical protein